MDRSKSGVSFMRVKEILDEAISAWADFPANGGPPDLSGHGPSFSWKTKEALLQAVGHGNQLIQPDVIGNGKGSQANLLVVLRTGLRGPATRMPEGGPYVPDAQIREIEDWVNAGCPD
jgi:hypothetical protein